ncbi:MAG: hypothetical protein Q7J06_04695, partial [Bacteroidales bacterium]|nr:hypothetical protein [Bacteroidales bacterium]
EMQTETLSQFPISISTSEQSVGFPTGGPLGRQMGSGGSNSFESFPDEDVVYQYQRGSNRITHTNVLTEEFLNYIEELETELPGAVNTITYTNVPTCCPDNSDMLSKCFRHAVLMLPE